MSNLMLNILFFQFYLYFGITPFEIFAYNVAFIRQNMWLFKAPIFEPFSQPKLLYNCLTLAFSLNKMAPKFKVSIFTKCLMLSPRVGFNQSFLMFDIGSN